MTLVFSPPKLSFDNNKQPLKLLSRDTTDFKWGKMPSHRTIEELLNYGIINLDKPPNPTSHEVVSYVKKILGIPKAGHSGTLDPQVTGVLPTALGKATRILDTLLLAGKEYVGNMRLHADIDEQRIRSIVGDYAGDLYQRPPLRASVKRVLRIRTIYNSEILDIKEREVLFRISCQAGFYVRKYCHDIGQSLSCGAHMKELRRTRSGPFSETDFLSTLHDLYDAYEWYKEEEDENPLRNIILPMEYGVKHIPKIIIKDSAVDTVCHGAPLALPGISRFSEEFKAGEMVAIYTLKNELIALGEAQIDAITLPEKDHGIASSVKRVLMPIGTYPSSPNK